MNTELEAKESPETPQDEVNVIAAIAKIQKHLIFLEKKIDTLIEQSKERSFNKGPQFSKSFKPHSRGGQFSKPYKSNNRGGGHFSKPYKSNDRPQRSGNFNLEQRPDKPWGGNSGNRGNFSNKKRKFHGGQSDRVRNTSVVRY